MLCTPLFDRHTGKRTKRRKKKQNNNCHDLKKINNKIKRRDTRKRVEFHATRNNAERQTIADAAAVAVV